MTSVISPSTDPNLARSQAFCEEVTRVQARNFYYGLKLLPPEKRRGMFALYAWMRLADDLADDSADRSPASRIAVLEAFRRNTHEGAKERRVPLNDSWPGWHAFIHCVESFGLKIDLLDDMIDGQVGDILFTQPQTFAQLREYCYRVASVVGLASIQIWGFTGGEQTRAMAVDRGIAFQLTNILRDVREDAARGRYYLPLEDMRRFSIDPGELLSESSRAGMEALLRFEIQRAKDFFASSDGLESCISADSRSSLWAMTAIYSGILSKISHDPLRVLNGRVRLNSMSKSWIALRAWISR